MAAFRIIADNIVIKIILKEEKLELKQFGLAFLLKLISSKLITLSWLAKTCLCSQQLDLENNWFTTIQNMQNYLYRSENRRFLVRVSATGVIIVVSPYN